MLECLVFATSFIYIERCAYRTPTCMLVFFRSIPCLAAHLSAGYFNVGSMTNRNC